MYSLSPTQFNVHMFPRTTSVGCVCMYVCMYVCISVCVCVCVCVCVHVRVRVRVLGLAGEGMIYMLTSYLYCCDKHNH